MVGMKREKVDEIVNQLLDGCAEVFFFFFFFFFFLNEKTHFNFHFINIL